MSLSASTAGKDAKYATIPTATVLTTDASVIVDGEGHGDPMIGTGVMAHAVDVTSSSSSKTIGTVSTENNNAYTSSVEIASGSGSVSPASNGNDYTKGVVQEPAYRDKWFGIAFVGHLLTMITVTCLYATGTLETTNTTTTTIGGGRMLMSSSSSETIIEWNRRFLQYTTSSSYDSYNTEEEEDELKEYHQDDISTSDVYRFIATILATLIIAPALTIVAMKFMKTHGVQLIQFSLYFAIGFNILIGVLLMVAGPAGVIWLVFAGILACYAKAVWHRIPFAAANLKSAVTCVESNCGMTFLAVMKIPLLTGWMVMWAYNFTCVMSSPFMVSQEYDEIVTDDYEYGRSNTHEVEGISGLGVAAIMGLLLSLYWTSHVLHNVVHTTLAGTVGTWWVAPLTPGLTDSLCRSLTYSFGSICFGSLLVAIIEVVKSMVRSAARNRRSGIFMCIAQCLLHWIERIAEYFNKWAFIYVGLYGYGYIEAGKNVFSLFKHRGWTTIISDSLVSRMLGVVCLCIGLINALVATLLTLGAGTDVMSMSALVAFFTGVIFSLMVASVLISCTDTIIVLWAEAPSEFYQNHPVLAQEMEATWSQAWPDVFTSSPEVVATPIV